MLVENYKDRIISKLQTDTYGYSEIQARSIYKSICWLEKAIKIVTKKLYLQSMNILDSLKNIEVEK